MEKQKNLRCRICDSNDLREDVTLPTTIIHATGVNDEVSFMVCNCCGTIQAIKYVKFDYSDSDAEYLSQKHEIKMYLDIGAGYSFFLSLLLLVFRQIGEKKNIKFLDLGGGVGITSHMAKLLFGWDVINADPTVRCKVGGDFLGIRYLHDYVDESTFHDEKFDVIMCSEVIEHVYDPDGFLKIIAHNLTPTGLLLLTTPNADATASFEDTGSDWVELYAPGQHYNIFSKNSMQLLLQRNGFANNSIIECEGLLDNKRLIVMASSDNENSILPLEKIAEMNCMEYFDMYCNRALSEETRNEWHEIYKNSLKMHLFGQRVNQGKYQAALNLSSDYAEMITKNGFAALSFNNAIKANNWVEFMNKYPTFMGNIFIIAV